MLRILVVDDDPVVGRALVRALRGRVDVFYDATPDAALERLRVGERYDLILSDVTMPGTSGSQFFERAVALAPEMRGFFAFASGGMSESERARLAATGCPCLEKPVTKEAILGLLADGGERLRRR